MNSEISYVSRCYGVTKDPEKNDYLLIFEYAKNGDLHNNLLKNLLGKTKSSHLFRSQEGKILIFLLLDLLVFNKCLVK